MPSAPAIAGLVALYVAASLAADRVAVARRRARCVAPELFQPPPGVETQALHARICAGFVGPVSAFVLRRRLARQLHQSPRDPALHYEEAHLHAARAEGEPCLDALARALYFSGGETFYARPLLDSPWAAKSRPSLVEKARLSRLASPPNGR